MSDDRYRRLADEEALRKSEERLRTGVSNVPIVLFALDREGVFTLSEGKGLEVLELEPGEVVGRSVFEVYRDIPQILENVRRALAGEALRTNTDVGGIVFETWYSPLREENGGVAGVVGIAIDVTERKRMEGNLRRSMEVLLALRDAGQVLGSTLESEEIVSRLLEIMQRVSSLTATVISRQDEGGELRIWRSVGLEGLWRRARFSPGAETARRAALRDEEELLFQLQDPRSGTEHLVGLCLPLRTRDRVLGVLEAYGSESLAENDTLEILRSLTSQAASALENARLYGKLAERERQLKGLVGRLIAVQEEERRRVAYEIHDGLTQMLVAVHQHLQSFAHYHPPNTTQAQEELDWILELAQRAVVEARRVIGDLRPTALDDFGLGTALRLEVEALRAEGWQIGYKETLGATRLPPQVETALFRVAQEALTNVRKHAQKTRVDIELGRRGDVVGLQVRDWGPGFDTADLTAGGGPGERVGLTSMRERVALLGGTFEISSWPGGGTVVAAEVSLLLVEWGETSYGA